MPKVVRMTPRTCDRLAPRNITPAKQGEIAALAYKYWLDRGFKNGSPQEDWLRAKLEVAHRLRASGVAQAALNANSAL